MATLAYCLEVMVMYRLKQLGVCFPYWHMGFHPLSRRSCCWNWGYCGLTRQFTTCRRREWRERFPLRCYISGPRLSRCWDRDPDPQDLPGVPAQSTGGLSDHFGCVCAQLSLCQCSQPIGSEKWRSNQGDRLPVCDSGGKCGHSSPESSCSHTEGVSGDTASYLPYGHVQRGRRRRKAVWHPLSARLLAFHWLQQHTSSHHLRQADEFGVSILCRVVPRARNSPRHLCHPDYLQLQAAPLLLPCSTQQACGHCIY